RQPDRCRRRPPDRSSRDRDTGSVRGVGDAGDRLARAAPHRPHGAHRDRLPGGPAVRRRPGIHDARPRGRPAPVREAIARAADANDDFHYYWSEGIGQQLLLVPLGGWVVGAAIALGVCLIVTLPVLSLRAPRVVAAGSRIEPGAQDSL